MSNVEDMLEGYDWASDDVMGRKNAKGAVDLIEARLTGELMALENVGFNYLLVAMFSNNGTGKYSFIPRV